MSDKIEFTKIVLGMISDWKVYDTLGVGRKLIGITCLGCGREVRYTGTCPHCGYVN